jgi:actin-like ATPase involved in cell morphogenesis
MRVLGIDFGTSNTVGMLRLTDGRLRPLLFDGSPLLPSAVYLGTDGRMLVGRDAERHARLDPSRFEPNPKRSVDDGHLFLGDREMPVAQVFSLVLGHVATEAKRQLGAPPEEVRLTHPARWGDRRRGALVEAARIAGLGSPRLIPEPVGAASYFTAVHGAQVPVGRSLAIYDLGGGTFDATVVRRTQTGFDVLAEEGLQDVGGLDFDHAIVEHLGITYRASHGNTWERLVNPADANDRRSRRMLYEDVRGAKEMLSRTTNADIHIPALEVDAHLTREEFENLVRPYLDRTIQCLQRAIAAARAQPQDLTGIFLVGGSSRIPLAAHMIHTALGVAPTTLEQPETVVVEGALCIGAARPSGPPVSGPPRQVHGQPGRPPQGPPQGPPRGPAGPMVPQNRPMGPPQAGPPVGVNPGMRPAAHPAGPVPTGPGPMPPGSPMGTNRPVSTPPVSTPPVVNRPPVPAGPPQRPVSLQRPPAYGPPAGRPPMPAGPQPVAAQQPQMRPPQRQVPPPMARPQPPRQPQPQTRPAQRPWYSEPTVLGTIGVLVVVAILFIVLITQIMNP